jgi:uncharacterized protein YprB with RNaseH-like and TPR domain
MKEHGMIETVWCDETECADGREAMLVAWNAYKSRNPLKSKGMKEVIKYNEVDVKVLQEILSYIRKMI